MLIPYSDMSFANADRKLYFLNRSSLLLSMGRKSYVMSALLYPPGSTLDNIIIGNYCSLGNNIHFIINQNHNYKALSTYRWASINLPDHFAPTLKAQVIIGNDVFIGNNVTILSGLKIGNGAIIRDNSLVTKDVPPYAVIEGQPGKITNYRFDEETRQKLNQIKWWYWPEEKITKNTLLFNEDINAFIEKFYQVEIPSLLNDNINNLIQTLHRQKHQLYYFIPDLDEPNPIWENFIPEFINHFSASDHVALFLITKTPRVSTAIKQLIENKTDAPKIYFLSDTDDTNLNIFSQMTYFVTTKDISSIRYVDYAFDYGINVLFGTDNKLD